MFILQESIFKHLPVFNFQDRSSPEGLLRARSINARMLYQLEPYFLM